MTQPQKAEGTELVAAPETAGTLTIRELTTNIARIQAALKDVMKEGIHYGKIPGTDKPSLFKPGAEVIATMFRLAPYPIVQDLSTPDCIRYRVLIALTHSPSGVTIGHGVGECSTDEEKYKWRRAVCDPEWDAEDPARRREKWNKGKEGSTYKTKQVRTQPADAANTILKMAKKRALVDAVLTCTACSDIFHQDVEDLSPELRGAIYGAEEPAAPAAPEPRELNPVSTTGEPPPAHATGAAATDLAGSPMPGRKVELVTAQMVKTITGRLRAKGINAADLCAQFSPSQLDRIGSIEELPKARINEVLEWIERK